MRSFKTFLLLALSLAFAGEAFAVTGYPGVPLPADVENMLNLSATAGPAAALGTQVTQKKVNVMKAVYDYTKMGGANGAMLNLKDAAGGQAVLPKGAIIKQVIIDEITNVTTSGGASIRVGVNAPTMNDLLGATAVASFANVIAGIPVGTAATSVKLTSGPRAIVASISGGSVTAGKLNIFLEYYLSD